MGFLNKIWFLWRKVDPAARRHYKQTATWISLYMVICPIWLFYTLNIIYDMQTAAAVRTITPDEVTEENYQKWLKKQNNEGHFLEDEHL